MKKTCCQAQNGQGIYKMYPKAGIVHKKSFRNTPKITRKPISNPDTYILSAFKIIMEFFCIEYNIPKQMMMTWESGV